MHKASQLSSIEDYQLCAAHTQILLLTCDSLNRIGDLAGLFHKCKSIVTTVHFNPGLLEDALF